jgi:hypothetical protein
MTGMSDCSQTYLRLRPRISSVQLTLVPERPRTDYTRISKMPSFQRTVHGEDARPLDKQVKPIDTDEVAVHLNVK